VLTVIDAQLAGAAPSWNVKSDEQDYQHPDSTITFTAPNGRVYTTEPDGRLVFPQFAVHVGELGPARFSHRDA
jgi:hypothetical protein